MIQFLPFLISSSFFFFSCCGVCVGCFNFLAPPPTQLIMLLHQPHLLSNWSLAELSYFKFSVVFFCFTISPDILSSLGLLVSLFYLLLHLDISAHFCF